MAKVFDHFDISINSPTITPSGVHISGHANAIFRLLVLGGEKKFESEAADSVAIDLQGQPSVTKNDISDTGFWSHTYQNVLPGTKTITVTARLFAQSDFVTDVIVVTD